MSSKIYSIAKSGSTSENSSMLEKLSDAKKMFSRVTKQFFSYRKFIFLIQEYSFFFLQEEKNYCCKKKKIIAAEKNSSVTKETFS